MSTSLPDLVALFQRTLHLPDAALVYLALGVVAGNRLPGDPIWLLVVGPPSSGKTEALGALSGLPEFHSVGTITVPGLLTAQWTADGVPTAGGLLVQIGERGLVVASDFGTLLNQAAATRGEVFAALREVFDGKFIRRLGSGGGMAFTWDGHVGMIAACTEAIDSSAIDLGVLGERFCYYRIPAGTASDDYLACMVSDENSGHQPEIRSERAEAVASFVEGLNLPDELPDLTEPERERLIVLSTIGTRCRSSVVREGYSREIELVPGRERSPRLYGELRQLHAGLTVIGTPSSELWRSLAHVALGGIHPGRRAVLDYLMEHPGEHSTASIAGHCRLPETPTRRHLQDLTAHEVLDRIGDHPERWTTSEWLQDSWWAVDGEWTGSPSEPAHPSEAETLWKGGS